MRPSRRSVPATVALPLALAATVSAGCGAARKGGGPALPTAQVVFVNQALTQADVFAVAQGGAPFRIGTVPSGRQELLRVPASIVTTGTVNFVARLLADGRAPSTGPVTLRPGDRLQVTLSANPPILSVLPLAAPDAGP